jgi:hypothetical protein
MGTRAYHLEAKLRGFISILLSAVLDVAALRPLDEYKLIRARTKVYRINAMLYAGLKYE